ncbi:MAG: Gfo/Idh/MocA family oxidoreductase [Chloroflexota bacterium]|nr:Gfo/Idh/MocA family oxidoreductase [Chloroflexota bacterium]
MTKVRWGILSTANIGTEKVIPAMMQAENVEVLGIASRDLEKAQAAATRLGVPRAYGSYAAMLADPDIDAVYNPLPNHLHVPWSIKALEAGKHVLCEKPIALTADEGQLLVDAAKAHSDQKVMEAFMYRHHPQWLAAKALVADGSLGELRTIQTFFSYFNDDPDNVRNMADIGGGGLMDIGCYAISLARFIFGKEPERVCGVVEYDPEFETDRLASALMDFGDGTATFTTSTQLVPYQRVNIFGTEGRVEIEIPFNAPRDKPCRIWVQRGDDVEEVLFDVVNQYTIQGDLMSQAILDDTDVPTAIEDAVANMRVIEAIVESDRSGTWVAPASLVGNR